MKARSRQRTLLAPGQCPLPPIEEKATKNPLETETLEGVCVGFLYVLVHTASVREYSITIAAGELLSEV